jgi:hypothetical protein
VALWHCQSATATGSGSGPGTGSSARLPLAVAPGLGLGGGGGSALARAKPAPVMLVLACIAAVYAVAVTANHNLNVQRALSARDERALLAALEDRGRALGALLQSRDVTAALALARGAPRSRELLPPSARALLQDEWASATVSVATLMGLPLPGAATAAPHYVHVTFPGGRRARVHPASVATAGLPVVGSVPVQGFFYLGEFVADSAGAECGAPAGGRVECVVGGEVRVFVSAAAAELEVAALWRQAGARSLQMGADPANAPSQTAFDPSYTSGLRKVLLLNVRYAGQSPTNSTICSMDQVRAGASALKQHHGQRSFGKVTISTMVVGCLIELPMSDSWYRHKSSGYSDLHDDALTALLRQNCSSLSKDQLATFQHHVVYHPKSSFDNKEEYLGLGQVFGRRVWMNGPLADNFILCHEIGHNYGLMHAASWPIDGNFTEYGDTTDVMGSRSSRPDSYPFNYGMVAGDYSSASKVALGWIPFDRYVALHPHGISAASGLVSGASFSLAALDRNNAIGVNPFTSYPLNAVLAARLTLPTHSAVVSIKSDRRAEQACLSAFAFLHFRAMARVPGIYMVEAALGSSAMSNPVLVCNEALCREQAPLARAFDAFVYDHSGTRALIEVGAFTANVVPNTPNITNTDLQNSVYQVTVSYLGSNGRKLGAALPAVCNVTTGLCPADMYTDVPANSSFVRFFSGTSPIALFRAIISSDGAMTIKACNRANPPLTVAPIGVSAFLGGFPTAHAFYTGSVGVSGDAVSPGEVPSAPFATCANTTLAVAAGRVVWVAVGSPGNFRGSALSASVTITMGGRMPMPTGACSRGSYQNGANCVLCPIPGQSSNGLATSPQDCFCPTDFLPTASGCVGHELGGPNAVSASAAASPTCPAGNSLSDGTCLVCSVAVAPRDYRTLILGASIGGALLLVLFSFYIHRRCLSAVSGSAASKEPLEAPAPPPRNRAPSAGSFQASSLGTELPSRAVPKAARRPSEAQVRSPSLPLRSTSARGDNLDVCQPDVLAAFLADCARGDAASAAAALRAAPPPLVQQLLTAQAEPSGRSPLHLAVRAGSLPLVQLLLEWGAPPNARDGARRTPLCAAARARDGSNAAVLVGALLSGGASATRSDVRGRTALHHAALACNLDAVAQLLEWGAAPQAEDAEGATPLELAERTDGASPRAMFRLRELLQARPGAAGRGSSSRPLVLLEPGRLPRSSSAAAPLAPMRAEVPQTPGRPSKRGPSVGAYV